MSRRTSGISLAAISLVFVGACTSSEGTVESSTDDGADDGTDDSSSGAASNETTDAPSDGPTDGAGLTESAGTSDGEPIDSDETDPGVVEPVPVPSGTAMGAAGAPAVEPQPSIPTPVMPAPTDGLGSVGASCETTADCAGTLTCFNAEESYFGGTYPNGICTVSCASDPFICDMATSVCVGSEVEAYCAPRCLIGDTGAQKCRPDQACAALPPDGVDGFCEMMCRDDMDCPADQACDVASGLCKTMPHEGKTVGETCVSNEECEGFVCLPAEAGALEGLCSQYCGLSTELLPCGVGDVAPGACDIITSILITGLPLGPGDLGLCAATCELDTGCAAEGYACAELTEAAATNLGSTGLCLPATLLEPPVTDAGAPVAPPVGDAGTL